MQRLLQNAVSLCGWELMCQENLIMAWGYRPVDRDQQFLLPLDMREWLPESHLVWFVIETVEQLDTSAFHERSVLGGVGRAGFDPDMLLTLLVCMAMPTECGRRGRLTGCVRWMWRSG
jgi:transposase